MSVINPDDTEYLPSYHAAELYNMNVEMKRCLEDAQEKCPNYEAKCSKPGKVDLTCTWWRPKYLGKSGGDICTAPPKQSIIYLK